MTDAVDLLRAEADARAHALPLPDAAQVWRSGTRRRRRAQVLSASAVLVVLAALVGAVLVLPGTVEQREVVVAAAPSAEPSVPGFRAAAARAVPTWTVLSTEGVALHGQEGGPWQAEGRTYSADGVTGSLRLPVEDASAEVYADWVRVAPAVDADEVARFATSEGLQPLGPEEVVEGVSTRAWSTEDGFVRVFAWSPGGGVADLRGGGGPVDPQALADRAALLLRELLGGPGALSPSPAPAVVADPQVLADLRAFARDPSPQALAAVPLAPTVALWLGTEASVERDAAALADPGQWAVPPPGGLFAGRDAVPTALELLAEERSGEVVSGPHAHCAGPPRPAPAGLQDTGRVSVQAAEASSCLEWWTVDAFVRDGVVVAVSLDLWEP